MTAAKPTPVKPPSKRTAYSVLEVVHPEHGGIALAYHHVVQVTDTSAEGAIRQAVKAGCRGVFVAVPERSLRPIEARVEVTEKLVIRPWHVIPRAEPLDLDRLGDQLPEGRLAPGDPGRLEMTAENHPDRVVVPGDQHEALAAVRAAAVAVDPDDIPF